MKVDLFSAFGVFAWTKNATQTQRAYGRDNASKPHFPHVLVGPGRLRMMVFRC